MQPDCKHLRVAYAGTPEFAVPALQALIHSTHEVVAVYTQPDRPAGRGRKLTASAVKQAAVEAKLTVFQPVNFHEKGALEQLQALDLDLLVVAAYGILLPASVLELPRLGCLNIHASLLPRWRGAAPLQRAILAGDEHTGITIMLMDEGLDTGAMLYKESVALDSHWSCQQLHDEMAEQGADALMQVLPRWCRGDLLPTPQPQGSNVSYASKISKAEAVIDWSEAALGIHRKIMAFNPWPIAQTQLGTETLRIWRSRLIGEDDQQRFMRSLGSKAAQLQPGDVVRAATRKQMLSLTAAAGAVEKGAEAQFWVATGNGLLALDSVQLPGKKPVAVDDFLRSKDLSSVRLGLPE